MTMLSLQEKKGRKKKEKYISKDVCFIKFLTLQLTGRTKIIFVDFS